MDDSGGHALLRYLLFAYGASEQVILMLLLSAAMHGFVTIFVTGFMYTEEIAPKISALRHRAYSPFSRRDRYVLWLSGRLWTLRRGSHRVWRFKQRHFLCPYG